MHSLVRLRPTARLAFVAALLVAMIAGLWTFGSTQASAHWPVPQIGTKCANDGGWAVSFQVESWKKSDVGGGGNPHVDVAYQVDDGAWQTLPWKANYSFTELNNFAFDDFFNLPAGNAAKVRIKVWTVEKWSDGYKNADPKYSDWKSLPKDCQPKTTTTKKPHTTTTEKPTTTTKPSTTTTEPCETTTTTMPTTTTTTKPSTTTTEKPTTTTTKPSTTTTEKPTTTTTAPPAVAPTTAPPAAKPAVTAAPPTPTVVVKSSGTLPITGTQSASLLFIAAGLMAGGFMLIRAARTRS